MRKPTKHWLALILALWVCACVGHGTQEVKPSSIYGHWIVKRLIPTSGISSGPEDLDPWIGASVFYSASEARFGSQAVKDPRYKITRVSAEDFFRDNRCRLEEIGIHARSVIEIDLVDIHGQDVVVKGPGSLLFFRSKNVMVTVWDGGYFEMVRSKH